MENTFLPAEKTSVFEYLGDMTDEEIYEIIKDGYTEFLFDICYNMTVESLIGISPTKVESDC